MKMNPVYKREVQVGARSFRLALILMVFNGILALVALLNMYSTLAQVRVTAQVQYSNFLDLYLFVAVLEFAMLVFIMPAVTAGSISGERERQTLELMLTTPMTPAQIVMGKLASALSTMFLLIVSSAPIISIVFVYGGVTGRDIILLVLCYTAAAFFSGSLGLYCSALFRKTTMATVASYGLTALSLFGTYGLNQFLYYMSQMHADSYLVSAGQAPVQATSGGALYLMLLNPAVTFWQTILSLAGQEQAEIYIGSWFGNRIPNAVLMHWGAVSVIVQIGVSMLLVRLAIHAVSAQHGSRSSERYCARHLSDREKEEA